MSVKEPVTAGDVRETVRYPGEKSQSAKGKILHPADDPDLSETTNSVVEDEATEGKGPTAASYQEVLRYAKQTDRLLTSTLQLSLDMACDHLKQAGAPTGYAKRYNDIKGEWRAVAASVDDELMKKIRG